MEEVQEIDGDALHADVFQNGLYPQFSHIRLILPGQTHSLNIIIQKLRASIHRPIIRIQIDSERGRLPLILLQQILHPSNQLAIISQE
jgi:hypothetical protein